MKMMKKMFFGLSVLSMFYGSLASATSSSAKTKELCMNISGIEFGSDRVLGTALCDVTQTMSQSELGSTWKCSFNGAVSETLNTIATWVSDGDAEQAQTIFYDIFSGEDLGNYLLTGLNLASSTTDGAFLEVVLDATPHALNPDLMLSTGSGTYDGIHFASIQNGSCEAQSAN